MLTQQTLTQLRSLKLSGMGDALQDQLSQPSMSSLSFEERLGLRWSGRWPAEMTGGAPDCSAWPG